MERKTLLLILLGIAGYVYLFNRQDAQNVIEAGIDYGAGIVSDLRRGERINNPFNIRQSSNPWQGLSASQPDSAFAAFDNVLYGIRAGIKILATYFNKYGLNTVRGIINKYAPSSENDTGAYVSAVSNQLGVSPDTPLTFNFDTAFALAKAIINHEQGRVIYSDNEIAQGVQSGLA